MRRLDFYIFRQLAVAFLFFSLVLAGLIWLTQAVRLIDTVLTSGQSLWRLFEFSLLVLPKVLAMVLPLAGFAATLFAINKLYVEAELVVMMMSGQGPFALARPVMIFAALVAAATLLVTNFLAPLGERQLIRDRTELQSEVAGSLIRDGRFLHPTDGLTIFIREVDDAGRMQGLFLHDERDRRRPVTYTAEDAVFLQDGPLASLIMNRGAALSFSPQNKLLARVQFDRFTYDLSELVAPPETLPLRPDALPTAALFRPDEEIRTRAGFDAADLLAHAHERQILGLDALLLPLLGLAVMLTGGYQRRGFGRRIMAAVGAGLLLVVGGVAGKSIVIQMPMLWPLNYLPAMLAALAVWYLLRSAGRARRRPSSGTVPA